MVSSSPPPPSPYSSFFLLLCTFLYFHIFFKKNILLFPFKTGCTFNSAVYLSLLEDTEPNIRLTRAMCDNHDFHSSNIERQSFDLKIQKICVEYMCHLCDFLLLQVFLSLTGPTHTDKTLSFPSVPPRAQRALLQLTLISVHTYLFGVCLPTLIQEVYLRNGSNIFWARVEGFYCFIPGTRETSKRMYVPWLWGGNLTWQVEVRQGIWARGDFQHTLIATVKEPYLLTFVCVLFCLSAFPNTSSTISPPRILSLILSILT